LFAASLDQRSGLHEIPASLPNVPRNFVQRVRDLDVGDESAARQGVEHTPRQCHEIEVISGGGVRQNSGTEHQDSISPNNEVALAARVAPNGRKQCNTRGRPAVEAPSFAGASVEVYGDFFTAAARASEKQPTWLAARDEYRVTWGFQQVGGTNAGV